MDAERALGFDYGERRIGVALSDALGLTAQPLTVLVNRPGLLEEIEALVKKHGVRTLVVGLPRHMNGEEGVKAEEARTFGTRIGGKTGVPVEYVDERLTSLAVNRLLAETEMSGAKKRAVVDKLAAALILQTWMDRKRNARPG